MDEAEEASKGSKPFAPNSNRDHAAQIPPRMVTPSHSSSGLVDLSSQPAIS